HLTPNQSYKVIKPFTDFDRQEHTVGETWTFVETNFLPYDDGLTLHVIKDGVPVVYRLQWREEEQAGIIDNFKAFVEDCPITLPQT
ncbi:MAG: DUF3601 domain-containing protein, partial [Phycisphaerae bacterium]|nr:DUF3601 domain-containing protein [Saprospiraceae bacterium]